MTSPLRRLVLAFAALALVATGVSMSTAATSAAPTMGKEKPRKPAPDKATHISVAVDGMSCGSCAAKIEAALLKVKGVMSANVDVMKKVATIKFDAAVVSAETIVKTISNAGYKPGKPKTVTPSRQS